MSNKVFHCVRCGLGTYRYGALCNDCRLVLSAAEIQRWVPDGTSEFRRAMESRLIAAQRHPLTTREVHKIGARAS